ncbi:hypothetical protein FNV43_RR25768 [Rhamnella rubrinervis]|uniref:YTH domain-containing family protein n=1 Tax=Rhamnella rubrinervis TaxID=2594499 RepID=A0A8K0GNN7_9ROSA|nr:hypothetical protein FNV43_RR25768 [Rhamnella rubrinervis]
MATAQQRTDRITSTASPAALDILSPDTKEKPGDSDKLNVRRVPNPPTAAVSICHPRDVADHLGQLQLVGDHNTLHPPNSYTSQAQLIYPGGKWGTYPAHANADSLGNGSAGTFNQNSSLLLHSYGFIPQMSHTPYAPSSVRLPSVNGHGHLYSAQQFPASDPPYYQQPVSPNLPIVASLTPVPQAKVPLNFDQQGRVQHLQPTSVCPSPLESCGRESTLFRNSGGSSLMQQGFEACGDNIWPDFSKPLNGQSSLVQMSPLAASLKPAESHHLPGNNLRMDSQQKGSYYGFGPYTNSQYRGYSLANRDCSYGGVSAYGPGFNRQIWCAHKEEKQGGRLSDLLSSCAGRLETLTSQNKGPRASKLKSLKTENSSTVNKSKSATSNEVNGKSYNQVDFATNHKDVKFFVIKSYSEDNVHMSIKYGVWASTPSGNKKLDAAYHEAKAKHWDCPIFLLFSVNASGQFCGVAEMVGPVDFDKSVDYWQQDKWTGQFPVKWHVIKDVPNSQFRHILVKDNENRPVTNSRDTQENESDLLVLNFQVEMEQGIDMLHIFKNYEADSSILDDFDFYEKRHKALQERKVNRQSNPVLMSVIGGSALQHATLLSNGSEKKMSKSFVEALSLNSKVP